VVGWARACAGTLPGDCSTMEPRTDGWDGWISLSGTGYGVTYTSSTGAFGGYAWGDVNVGWVDFSGVSTEPEPPSCQVPPNSPRCNNAGETTNSIYDSVTNMFCSTCTAGSTCSNGTCVPDVEDPVCNLDGKCITANPILVSTGNTGSTISWDVSNVKGTCTVKNTNDSTVWSTLVVSGDAAGSERSNSLSTQTIFTLTCTDLNDVERLWEASVQFVPSFVEF